MAQYVFRRPGTDDPELHYYDEGKQIPLTFTPDILVMDPKRARTVLALSHVDELCADGEELLFGLRLLDAKAFQPMDIGLLDREGALLPVMTDERRSWHAVFLRDALLRCDAQELTAHASKQDWKIPMEIRHREGRNALAIEPRSGRWRDTLTLIHKIHAAGFRGCKTVSPNFLRMG